MCAWAWPRLCHGNKRHWILKVCPFWLVDPGRTPLGVILLHVRCSPVARSIPERPRLWAWGLLAPLPLIGVKFSFLPLENRHSGAHLREAAHLLSQCAENRGATGSSLVDQPIPRPFETPHSKLSSVRHTTSGIKCPFQVKLVYLSNPV